MSVTASGEHDAQLLSRQDYEMLLGKLQVAGAGESAAGCGHKGYPIERLCNSCFREERRARFSAESKIKLMRSMPAVFAQEFIEEAKRRRLTEAERSEIRQRPLAALEAAGLEAIVTGAAWL